MLTLIPYVHHWHSVSVKLTTCAALKSGKTEGLIARFPTHSALEGTVPSQSSLSLAYPYSKGCGSISVVEDVFSNVLVQPHPLKSTYTPSSSHKPYAIPVPA